MSHVPNVSGTLGALFVGGFIAAMFSGVVTVQCLVYFKCYPRDHPLVKLLVIAVWFIDLCHTIFIGTSLWNYLIRNFGQASAATFVPWSLALTIALTAILTFLVHCFFVHRIYRLSKQKLYIAIPLGVIASARLFFACLTTHKLITLRTLEAFIDQYKWSFTCGLGLSSLLDILTTTSLLYFLMNGRKENSSLNDILDTLMLYAFECGALTCAATIVSMICWLTMPGNLIFMGLHFIISKFYANSLLATLNTRIQLQAMPGSPMQRSFSTRTAISPSADKTTFGSRHVSLRFSRMSKPGNFVVPPPLRINVQESVICTVDDSTASIIAPTPTSDKEAFSLSENEGVYHAA